MPSASSSTKKAKRRPRWLPKELWSLLRPYLDEWRSAQPTKGFTHHCAGHHPEFDHAGWLEMTDNQRQTYEYGLLSIPKWKREEADEKKGTER